MPVPLDVITRKKLILVRQLYQRAVLQAEARHSYVDRIMALIGFDLTIESILKTVVSALNTAVVPKSEYQAIVQQADSELVNAGLLAVQDKAKIQHVRTLRNDAQHKAKYPNDTDVSDCRTYTRDFLTQIILNVWGENFESISLTDVINDPKVKGYLTEAEAELAKGDYRLAVVKAIAGMTWTISHVKNSIVGKIPWNIRAFVVSGSSDRGEKSTEVFETFEHMRDMLMFSTIGVHFPSYLHYKRLTRSIALLAFAQAGNYTVRFKEHEPDVKEAEYIIEFAVNAIIQIESLVGDINKPFGI